MVSSKGIILTPSEKDQQWGLYASFVTQMEYGPGEPYPQKPANSYYRFTPDNGRILQEYQLTYISKGAGWFKSESLGRKNSTLLKEGSFFILFPGEWHSYSPDPSTGWCEHSIGFKGSRMEELEKKGFVSRSHPVLEVKINDTITSLFVDCLNHAMKNQIGVQQVIAGLISYIMGYALFLDQKSVSSYSPTEEDILHALPIIKDEYKTITPLELSRRLRIGYSTFRSTFKKVVGVSPAKYIADTRLAVAKELLTYANIQVKEVSFELGMENFDYFSVWFKSKTGYTPKDYRNLSRGK